MNIRQQAPNEHASAFNYRADNPLLLLEYGDYTNARCQLLQPVLKNSLPAFKEAIWHTFRHFPNLANPQSLSMALAAEAARRQGHFWPMHQALFAHQSICSSSMLSMMAVRVGLQMDRFLNDIHDVTLKELVMADVEAAGMADVTNAPTLFVGTHRIHGKLTQARLVPLIHHYLRNPTPQVLSTVDQLNGIINWSDTGCHL